MIVSFEFFCLRPDLDFPSFPALYQYVEPTLADSTKNSEKSSLSCLDLFALLPLLFPEFGREVFAKVGGLEHRTNLDLAVFRVGIGAALEPFDGFFHGAYLPNPVAGDQFLGFCEGAVDNGALAAF